MGIVFEIYLKVCVSFFQFLLLYFNQNWMLFLGQKKHFCLTLVMKISPIMYSQMIQSHTFVYSFKFFFIFGFDICKLQKQQLHLSMLFDS